MPIQRPFLYRGTTVGWPGNDGLQQLGVTPTTADPLVATLFAVDASRYGKAVVQVCEFQPVAHLIRPMNIMGSLECEVVVGVPPLIYAERYVSRTIDACRARQILAEIGFELAPIFVNKEAFRLYLRNSPRLSDSDVAKFDALLAEGG